MDIKVGDVVAVIDGDCRGRWGTVLQITTMGRALQIEEPDKTRTWVLTAEVVRGTSRSEVKRISTLRRAR